MYSVFHRILRLDDSLRGSYAVKFVHFFHLEERGCTNVINISIFYSLFYVHYKNSVPVIIQVASSRVEALRGSFFWSVPLRNCSWNVGLASVELFDILLNTAYAI